MVFGKKVAILIGNGAEIRPLEMGRKGPEYVAKNCMCQLFDLSCNTHISF